MTREFVESPWEQGEDEEVTYSVTTTPWGGGSGSPAVTVKQGGDDVTAGVTSGSATGNADTVTTPKILNLTAGLTYRLEVKWTSSSGQVLEAYGFIEAKE